MKRTFFVSEFNLTRTKKIQFLKQKMKTNISYSETYGQNFHYFRVVRASVVGNFRAIA